MMKQNYLIGILLSLVTAQALAANLVVHEWGTFTSLVGSDGQHQNGMYHEDEVLPDFVKNFGIDYSRPAADSKNIFGSLSQSMLGRQTVLGTPQLNRRPNCKIDCELLVDQQINQKMETPVVYFYSDKAQAVRFDVRFPGGIISQSFPTPMFSQPLANPGVRLRNGRAIYDLEVLEKNENQERIPDVDAANIYSHARNVRSNIVQFGSEFEKFIFYRGLGFFSTQLSVTSSLTEMKILNKGDQRIPQIFLVNILPNQKMGKIVNLGQLESAKSSKINLNLMSQNLQNYDAFLQSSRKLLAAALIENGLFKDEAIAMIDTWEHGYFRSPGLRVLYVLPKEEVDQILPVKITPEPKNFSRVFVGRIEVLPASDERVLLNQILQQGEGFNIETLGRMAEPILLRLKELANNSQLSNDRLNLAFEALLKRARLN